MDTLVLLAFMLLCVLIGVPVAYALGLAAVAAPGRSTCRSRR